jgi:hypothetical protein
LDARLVAVTVQGVSEVADLTLQLLELPHDGVVVFEGGLDVRGRRREVPNAANAQQEVGVARRAALARVGGDGSVDHPLPSVRQLRLSVGELGLGDQLAPAHVVEVTLGVLEGGLHRDLLVVEVGHFGVEVGEAGLGLVELVEQVGLVR